MKKLVIVSVLLVIIIIYMGYFQLTGKVVDGLGVSGDAGPKGPSVADMNCMVECTTKECDVDDMDCRTAISGACGLECGVDVSGPPEPADEGEACMQDCIVVGCEKFDIACQNANMDKCEDECDMKGDAPDESEMGAEQLCISNCVAAEDPSMICGNSQEGETGGALCQKCAAECVHLYEGSCLNDEQLIEKENECIDKCEHCYGAPVEGPSGEGWDCIVDVKCGDASSEFGDEPGEGPGIGQEGFIAKTGEAVGNVFEGIGNFFSRLFGGGDEQ